MPRYVLLQPLSPDQGPVIFPAAPAAEGEPPAPPVLVDEALISAEAAPVLLSAGVIAVYEPPAPADPEAAPADPDPQPPTSPRKRQA